MSSVSLACEDHAADSLSLAELAPSEYRTQERERGAHMRIIALIKSEHVEPKERRKGAKVTKDQLRFLR